MKGILVLLFICASGVTGGTQVRYIYATAEVEPNPNYEGSNVRGIVQFRQKIVGRKDFGTEFVVNLTGFDNTDDLIYHATHIHTFGTIREGCEGSEGHYDPTNSTHGLLEDKIRHVGDLGNLKEDVNGNVFVRVKNRRMKLKGKHNIIGRTWDNHEFIDDGLPPNGHGGRRMSCGVVAHSNGDFWN